MLISPPFLPPRAAQQSEAAWLDQAMQVPLQSYIPVRGDLSVAGAYPISQEFAWHGGQHLVAPVTANVGLTVRAIADGTVVYVRRPRTLFRPEASDSMSAPADPLHYGRQDYCPTNDGTILIRHTTDIGAAGSTAVSITYYSLYCHLDRIPSSVVAGQTIHRKDELGAAGYIYGNAWQIHMEIFCDDANLALIVGRTSGELLLTVDGRSDVIYGEIYIHLPATTPVYGERPVLQNPDGYRQSAGVLEKLTPSQTTDEALIVGIRYGMGDGAQGGNTTVTTYKPDGTKVGAAFVEVDAEFNLHAQAKEIAKGYPADNRPEAGAIYELLRFGRPIAPNVLTPGDVPHWRKIRTSAGEGWVNLNAANTNKFSDADFPHWKGWNLIDASQAQNSHCDNTTIMGWFDADKDGKVSQNESALGQQNIAVLERMKRAICKFPSEWAVGTIKQRWDWLKEKTENNPDPLTAEDFGHLEAHAKALSFWEEAKARDANLPEIPWRFQPKAFVEHIRMVRLKPYFPVAHFEMSTVQQGGIGRSWLPPSWGEYGRSRSNGVRSHGGCDIYAREGEAIYAIKPGKIVNSETTPSATGGWNGTQAITVDHGDFIARYAEVKNLTIAFGYVKHGQKIAEVARTNSWAPDRPMLHFELFDKSETGTLSIPGQAAQSKQLNGRPTFRRKDLMNPTEHLEVWIQNIPPGDW